MALCKMTRSVRVCLVVVEEAAIGCWAFKLFD